MSLLKGAVTYSRFFVDGIGPDAVNTASLKQRAFLPLDVAADAVESAGWVLFDKPHESTRDELTAEAVSFGDRIVLAYREDKWQIPKPLIKRETAKRIAKIIAEGKPEEEIGKAFVKAVSAAVEKELRQTHRPKTKIVEVEWTPGAGVVRIFAKGAIAEERIAGLFERTFGVRVTHAHPAARAVRIMPAEAFADVSRSAVFEDVNLPAPDDTADE